MTTIAFDTLKASRKLKAAGIEEAQAEAIVQSMAEAFDDSVATKADLKAAIAEVKADMLKDRHRCRSRKRQPHRRSDQIALGSRIQYIHVT